MLGGASRLLMDMRVNCLDGTAIPAGGARRNTGGHHDRHQYASPARSAAPASAKPKVANRMPVTSRRMS